MLSDASAQRWAGSCCVSLAIHALLLALLFQGSVTFGAKAPGSGGIEVSLGPMSDGGGAASAALAAPAATITEAPPVPVAEAHVDEPPEPPDPDAFQQQVSKKKPPPVPPAPAKPKQPSVVKKDVAKPAKPVRDDGKATAAKNDAGKGDAAADTQGKGEDAGGAGDGKSSASGRGEGTNDRAGGPGGGIQGIRPSYFSQLQAWLEKHKEFPRAAQMRRQQGVARLFFVIDREGKVLDFRIEKSSGHELLDREVLAMIRRASPVPPMPDDMTESRLEVVVPVQFFLR